MISVQQFHTFQLQANAKQIIEVDNIQQLTPYLGKKNGKDFLLLGSGSNCVFLDDFYGDVVKLKLFGKQLSETDTHFVVEANASEPWHEFVVWLMENEVYGLENLALIPGTVGACPIQNIGAYGVEVSQFVSQVQYLDLNTSGYVTLLNDECQFGYRESIFKSGLKSNAIITKVTFTIPKDWQPMTAYGELKTLVNPSAEDIFEKVISVRQSKLPNPDLLGNAGSFFKNPIIDKSAAAVIQKQYPDLPTYPVDQQKVKIAAGWLIDKADLKGSRVNSIAVHDKQALVLVNLDNNGKGAELAELVAQVKSTVFTKFGVDLKTEVRCFGHAGEISTN